MTTEGVEDLEWGRLKGRGGEGQDVELAHLWT